MFVSVLQESTLKYLQVVIALIDIFSLLVLRAVLEVEQVLYGAQILVLHEKVHNAGMLLEYSV